MSDVANAASPDKPADTIESDSKIAPGENPVIGKDSPANK